MYKSMGEQMEDKIQALQAEKGLSRKDAAHTILDSKEGWYTQTPEGEYLTEVIYIEAGKEQN